jgi:hypothetical protein
MTGPIQIKRDDVAADIRALADLTGTSITDAVAAAVRAQLALERAKSDKEMEKRKKKADRLLAEIRKAPRAGPRLTDADLYDENGLPK